MREVKLDEKYTLKVAVSSYENASRLKDLFLNALKVKGIDFSSIKSIEDVKKIDMDSDFVMAIVNCIRDIETNDEITKQVIKCAEKCVINKNKVTEDTFENPELWPHMVEIKIEVIKENVYPFLKNLPSIFKKAMETALTKD